MEFILVMMGGFALIIWTIALLDSHARRKERRG